MMNCILFHQNHLLGVAVFAGFHFVEINAAGYVTTVVIFSHPSDGVHTGVHFGSNKRFYALTQDVVDLYTYEIPVFQ